MIPRFPQNSRRVRGGTILPERHFRRPRPGSVTGPRPRCGGRRGRSDDPARSGTRGNLKDDVSPFTTPLPLRYAHSPSATPIHPPLRPSSPYSEGPRSEAEQKRRSRRTARTGIGNAQRTRPWSRPRRHRPGRARRCPSPTPPGPRRPRPVRPGRRPRPVRPGPRWCEAGLGAGRPGVTRGRRAPSPACVMRARRNRIHPASRRASPARRNPPALDPRRLTSHNASPGDITKSTPPPRLSPEDACGSPGRRRSQRRGTAAGDGRLAGDGQLAGPLPPGCRLPSPTAQSRVRRSPPASASRR